MGKSILMDKSYEFAIQIVLFCRYLQQENREYILSKQLLRSGTAIGALIREAQFGQSRADFINKMSVALKEANETLYWLMLLKDTGYVADEVNKPGLEAACNELVSILVSTIKTTKGISRHPS